MNKIILCTIFRDDSEYDMIERMLESFMPHVHGLAVVLTGTSGEFNKLKELIASYDGHYTVTTPEKNPAIYAKKGESYIFANFAESRNESFRLAKIKYPDADYYTWADADDVLMHGEELQKAADIGEKNGLDSIFFTYWYSVHTDEKGNVLNVVIDHLRERLLRPGKFKWVSRLHEVAVSAEDNYQPRNGIYDINKEEDRKTVWVHLADRKRSENNLLRNIDILKIQAEEEKYKDPRTLFYLAKTYIDLHTMEDNSLYLQVADDYLNDYLEKSGWAEERANAWTYKGNIAATRGDHHGAIKCYHAAITEHPVPHLPYLLLAREYAEIGDFEKEAAWLDLGMQKPISSARTTIGNPMEIQVLSASLKYNQAIRKQDIPESIYWLKIRNQLLHQEDDGMVKTLEESKLMNDAAMWVFNYAKWLNDHGHKDRIAPLLSAIAPEFKHERFVQHIANEILEPKIWEKGSIVYYAGSIFADWDPKKAMEEGIGGSETALIRLSEEWVKLGYKVTVYANVESEGTYKGVEYKNYSTINWKDTFDTIILWRNASLLDIDINAIKILMDLHDIDSPLNWTPDRIKKVDKIFVKSQYHRKNIPNVPDEKICIIGNGIDL